MTRALRGQFRFCGLSRYNHEPPWPPLIVPLLVSVGIEPELATPAPPTPPGPATPQEGVDPEARRASGLECGIDPLDLLADQLERVGNLDRRLYGERDFGGVRRGFAEGRRAS